MTTTQYKVVIVGLSSISKSAFISSILKKRLLPPNIHNSSLENNNIVYDVMDDDNNIFQLINLPDICDTKNIDETFIKMAYNKLIESNLVIFVSDIEKAFLTSHEVNAYYKIKDILHKHQERTSTIHHITIMLSKCIINTIKNIIQCNINLFSKSNEDLVINKLIENVRNMFKNENVMFFNSIICNNGIKDPYTFKNNIKMW